MVCEYELDKGILKVNCLGCVHGSSIEDYEACMARTIDKIIENKNVEGIILSKEREYEYDYEQTRMLIEIANSIKEIVKNKKILSPAEIGNECAALMSTKMSVVKSLILEKMRSDPIGTYVSIKRIIRHTRIKINSLSERGARCHENFLNNVLMPIKEILDKLTLIKRVKPFLGKYHIGDRSVYREIFHPTIRPKFMRTKYISIPPKESEIVDRYELAGKIEVEIYRKPDSVRYYYHVTPPELKLSEDKYTILDAAIKYMTEHKPKTTEFAEPEKMRDVFSNIGRDLINDIAEQMGIRLSSSDVEEMTSILVRYTSGLGIIEILLADKKVQDIYINSPVGQVPIYMYHADFQECETNLIPTSQDAEYWATRFRIISGRPLDEANPVLDTHASVPGGTARIAVITRSLSPEGLGFAIRRHRDQPWTYPLFIQPSVKYMNPLFAGFMSFIIDGSRTFLIGGTRSSGKTSLLNASMLEIMKKNRIITVEDTLELSAERMKQLGFNIERLKSRSVITQVETELPTEKAIRTALRLGDSCLILGEVRSSIRGDEEVVIVDKGIMKRFKIKDLEGKKLENILVPTIDFDLKVKLSKLTDFIKHPKRKKLLKIITRTGREVVVTPDHSLFAPTKDFRIAPIECNKLKVGNQVVIPSRMICGFNDIDYINVFEYLPEFRVENFEEHVREAIKVLGWKKATGICNIQCGDVYNYFRRNQHTNMPFGSFNDLMGYVDIDYNLNELNVKSGTSLSIPAIIPVDEDFCRFLGYYVSEGYYSLDNGGGNVVITNSNTDIMKDISNISEKLFKLSPKRRIVEGLGKSVQHQLHCLPLTKLISKLECGRTCDEKRAPPIIFGLSKKKIAAFLRGLYSGDGSFTSSKSSGNSIRYFSISKKLIEDVAYLLLNFGIVARIREREKTGMGRHNIWILEFEDREMVETFFKEIGFVNKKSRMIKRKWPHTTSNSVIFDKSVLKEHLTKYPRRYRHLFRFLRCSKNYLKKVVLDKNCTVSERLKKFALGDFFLDEIKDIKKIELKEGEYVYDLSVEPTQNFVGGFGGILLHNTEAKALYEAMRIGALANTVAGTIHGESAYGIFDRVVNDLGVPPTSFKATDLIIICNMLRSPDGLHNFRRVVTVTEVRKHWKEDPVSEKGFMNLMEYSAKDDELKPTPTLLNGESIVLNNIASKVREWTGNWAAVWDNISLRSKIKKTITDFALKTGKLDLMEAYFVVKSNEKFHIISDEIKRETGSIEPDRVYRIWEEWLKKQIKEKKF